MNSLMTVVVATTNRGKLKELGALLRELPIEWISLEDARVSGLTINEDGDTFEDNAVIKARAVCRATGMVALADDSGLEVDAIGGRPGVRSARFAHERATDAENNAHLLQALEDVEESARTARFRCVLALASPWHEDVVLAEGRCEGVIARQSLGSGGFGYDPLFLVEQYNGRSMAELSEHEKNEVSHRGRAVLELLPKLSAFLNAQIDRANRLDRP